MAAEVVSSAVPAEATEGITGQIDDIERLIARRKITRATKLLDELLVEHPDEPRLTHIRDGLRARKQPASRRKTRPGTALPAPLKGERDDLEELDVN